MVPIIAYYSIYNEADFIKYSLESVCPYVDKTIIIEGAWRETYMVNGHKRSNDGTLDIVKDYIGDNKHLDIELHLHNEDSQLEQRNALWQYIKEDCIMLLVDGDEVWTPEEIEKIKELKKGWPSSPALPAHVYTVESLIFVNDFYNVSKVRYPRAWEIEANVEYNFLEPNRISANGFEFNVRDLDAHYFHYSYCHSEARFKEKKKERTKLHGNFAWESVGGIIRRPEASIERYTGDHPEGIRNHPLFGVKKHREVAKPEIIMYVEHSGIGNLVLSTPMLKAIRKHKPNAKLYVMSWKRAYRILEGADYIDHIYCADDKFVFEKNWERIDHLLISPVGAIDGIVKFLSDRSKRVYRLPPMQPWTQHESERKMLLARKLGYKGPVPEPFIKIFGYNYRKPTWEFADDQPYIAIGAAFLKEEHWGLKHWGDKKYAELIDRLFQKYGDKYQFVFVGSKQDKGDADRIDALVTEEEACPINMCGWSDDIKDTAAILSNAVLYIGNDSGLAHIAASVGTPTVTIFTFTNPVKNQPLGGKVVMVPCADRLNCQHGRWDNCEDKGCCNVPVEKVLEATYALLD